MAAAHLAELTIAHDYERNQFKTTPNMEVLTLHHADGEECSINVADDVLLTKGRHKLLQRVLHMVQQHLNKERKMLKRLRRRI